MRAAVLALTLASCAYERHALTTLAVYDMSMTLCDGNQTTWASDGGRWDRMIDPTHRAIETDPLLGATPSIATVQAVTAGGIVGAFAVRVAPLPRWVQWIALGAIAAAETFVVVDTRRTTHSPICGATFQ